MKGIVEFILLSLGAITGAFLRYKLTSMPFILGFIGSNVIIVNIIGSFVLGVFSVCSGSLNLDPKYSYLVAIGFCGSLTTMSSFALENVLMFENNQLLQIVINTTANIVLSFLFLYIGRILTIQILQ